MNREKLVASLIKHEALRLKPYLCTAGKTTIGVGRNLDDNGISEDEARILLRNDIERCVKELDSHLQFFRQLDDARQNVLIEMCFNLGIYRLLAFRKTLDYVASHKYEDASTEMLDSAWAKQVGQRASTLSDQMRTGEYPSQ